jgi:hypothetical protein
VALAADGDAGSVGQDRDVAVLGVNHTPYAQAMTLKWTRTQTSRLLLEAGAARGRTLYQELYQPNVIGDPSLSNPSPARWFNTAAFALSPYGTFGSAGRDILIGSERVRGGAVLPSRDIARPRERLRQALLAERLQDIVHGPDLESLDCVLVVSRDEDDRDRRVEKLHDLEAVEPRHLDVQEDGVRRELSGGLDGFQPVARLPDDRDARDSPEHLPQDRAGRRLVVDYKDPSDGVCGHCVGS